MRILRNLLIGLLGIILVSCGDTAPPPEAATLDPVPLPAEMVVIGDFGSGSEGQYEVAEAMRERVAREGGDLFVTTGDNFYNDDIDRIWNEPYGWLTEENIRIAAAWGNHDLDSDTRRKLVREALEPPGDYYSMDLGEGKLIVLDSNNLPDAGQTEWFRSELEDRGSPVIVVFHHPPYSCGVYGTEDVVNETWLPLLEDFDVPLVFNGHEHHYERFLVDETMYVVTGGGGRSLRPAETCPADTPQPLASNYTDHHFIALEIGDGRILAEVVAADGSTIDSFEIDY